MATTYTSPYATSFKNSCKRGTPFYQAVNNIAKKNNKSTQVIWNSLFKANLVWRQKFNGQWTYFPSFSCKTKATAAKTSQYECWQYFCEWMLSSGQCTPEQLKKNCGSQKEFMSWCRKFWGKQYTTVSSSSSVKKNVKKAVKKNVKAKSVTKRKTTKAKVTTKAKSTSKPKARKSTVKAKKTNARSYKFPTAKTTSKSRRFKKAA